MIVEHVAIALGVDLAIGIVSLIFRHRFVTAVMMLVGAIAWMVRTTGERASRAEPSALPKRIDPNKPPRGTGPVIGSGHRLAPGEAERLAYEQQEIDKMRHDGGHRGPSADGPTMPIPGWYMIVRDPLGSERTFMTAKAYRAWMDLGAPGLSHAPCISWSRRIIGPHSAVPNRRCPACSAWLNPGETHAPRPPASRFGPMPTPPYTGDLIRRTSS